MSKDPENKKITFIVTNKPSWIKFDNRTGNLSGRPGKFEIGLLMKESTKQYLNQLYVFAC